MNAILGIAVGAGVWLAAMALLLVFFSGAQKGRRDDLMDTLDEIERDLDEDEAADDTLFALHPQTSEQSRSV